MWGLAMNVLTVKPYGSICLAPRVLGHAFVDAVVSLLDVADSQLHVGLVRRGVDSILGPVLATLVDHVAVLPRPVVERRGMRLGEAFERDAVCQRRSDQLVWDPQHWGN